MKYYESVLIFQTRLTDADLETEQKKVEKLLAENGALDITIDLWGRRDLAYEVGKKRETQGVYVCFYYRSENGGVVEALNQVLRIEDEVLLFQTHRIDGGERKFKGRIRESAETDQLAI